MKRLNITAKIWLSVGIFVLGFVLATVLGQIQGVATESGLQVAVEAMFPAAQRSQEAEAAFQRAVKGFSDAVMIQDATGVENAAGEGRKVVEGLRALGATPGLARERSEAARALADSTAKLFGDARSIYGGFLANAASMTEQTQAQMRELAGRMDKAKAALQESRDRYSKDLQLHLDSMRERSASQRQLALGVFGVTLVVAFALVNLTIRRSIVGPVERVVRGVQNAADEAAAASGELAESGQLVARDAQDQAACVEETSASLEEISSTTRENASRAREADKLMGEAKQMVQRAAQAMKDLTASMGVIAKSSKEVSAVLKGIDEIAFHTNILALNAAVEAARAGEAGAGFSVVADEVRALAQRAAEAARLSGEIIQKTIKDVGHGVELVTVVEGAFHQVSQTIANGGNVVSQIASGSEEQARGVGHVSEAITRIETVTQRNAANAQKTAETAMVMSGQAQTTRRHLDELAAIVGIRQAA